MLFKKSNLTMQFGSSISNNVHQLNEILSKVSMLEWKKRTKNWTKMHTNRNSDENW